MLAQKASILEDLRRHGEARAAWRAAMELYREHGQTARLVSSLCALARYEARRGGLEDATKLANEAIAESAEISPASKVVAHRTASRIALIRGDGPVALQHAERALEEADRGEPPPGEVAHLLAARGRALQMLSRHEEASGALASATRLLLDVARGMGERHGLELRARAHDVARAGFVASLRQREPVSSAWWFREASHALMLAETIRGREDQRSRVGPEQRVRLQEQLRKLAAAHTRAVVAERKDATPEARANARVMLETSYLEYLRVLDEVEVGSRKGVDVSAAKPVDLAAYQKTLRKGTLVAAYVEADGRMHVMAITESSARLVDLGPADTIERGVEAWRDLASAPGGPASKVGARLYGRLLQPIEAELNRAQLLVVMPDGPLAGLPFGALVTKRGANGLASGYVIDRVAVRYVASGAVDTALDARPKTKGQGVVLFGDPKYGEAFQHLPGTAAEVEAISVAYDGEGSLEHAGAVAGIAAWDDGWRVNRTHDEWLRALHMACHGVVDARRPYLSGLVLAGGEILTAERVARGVVPAELVVLSACDTAIGEHRPGEGVLGLTRGFLQAGAPRVVVSTWAVSDRATVELMTQLHRRWRARDTSAPESLRQARLKLRNSGGKYAHPYYWAPFVLWGAE